jgi:plastocyanin
MNVKRILVIANETVASPVLRNAVRERVAGGPAEVFVVAPALNSRLRHWVSDEDEARYAAERRLTSCLKSLKAVGIEAAGRTGDADPLQAVGDALHFFPADEIVIVTHAEGRSNWLARDVIGRARSRFVQPIVHVAVETPQPPASRPVRRRAVTGAIAIAAAGVAALAALMLSSVSSAQSTRPVATTTIRVKASEFTFTLSAKSVKRGTVVFVVTNAGQAMHNFAVHGKATAVLQPGATARLVVTFTKAGKYAYLCTVGNHAAMGMKGVFVVRN